MGVEMKVSLYEVLRILRQFGVKDVSVDLLIKHFYERSDAPDIMDYKGVEGVNRKFEDARDKPPLKFKDLEPPLPPEKAVKKPKMFSYKI